MDKILENLFPAFFIILALVMGYMLFVFIPAALYADSKCLAAGYPKSSVTIGLDMYCIGLDGTVRSTVSKLK